MLCFWYLLRNWWSRIGMSLHDLASEIGLAVIISSSTRKLKNTNKIFCRHIEKFCRYWELSTKTMIEYESKNNSWFFYTIKIFNTDRTINEIFAPKNKLLQPILHQKFHCCLFLWQKILSTIPLPSWYTFDKFYQKLQER